MTSVLPRPTARRLATGLMAFALAGGLTAVGVTPSATADQDVVVSTTPETRHPRVMDGRVYAIANEGTDVVVGGTFTTIRNGAGGSPDITQPRLFRFDTETGLVDESFDPVLNGDVEAVTYSHDGQSILIAGDFTTVDGQPAKRIARLHLDGTLDTGFSASAGSRVKDFALVGDRLILGGLFGKINGQDVRGLAAIDPDTGDYDPTFDLPISESRRDGYAPFVQELDASADGRWLVIGGNFKRVGGSARIQVAVIDLAGTPHVANWSTDRFEPTCASVYSDTYIRGIDISPDSSFFVVNTTGAHGGTEKMCDTTSRWELPPAKRGGGLQPTWTDFTGGDTFWAVEVTETAVYVGGHMRWMNNPRPSPGGDNDGPGAVARPGIAALDPYTGVPLSWNPTRDRGRGVEAMLATDDYLMVGHDTAYFAGMLRQRLALLPVAGGTANPEPEAVQLPVRLYYAAGDSVNSLPFDGQSFGSVTTVSGPAVDGISWLGNRDGFVQGGQLSYFGPSQAFYRRGFTTSSVGNEVTNLSTSVGYVDSNYNLTPYDQPYGVAETRTAAFDGGRVFYTKTNSSSLFYRGYSLESGILEGLEWTASSRDWSGARSMEVIDGWLYAAWSDNKLYRFRLSGGLPVWSSRTVVNDGLLSGIPWAATTGLWSIGVQGSSLPPAPPAPVTCTGSSPWQASYFGNRTLAGAPSVVGCQAAINHQWGTGSPSSEIPANDFSARWTREIELSSTAQIRVNATSDDGMRVYVDGERVINQWSDGVFTSLSGQSPTLDPGTHTVTVEYYERGGGAFATVALEVVPVTPPPPPPPPDTEAPDAVVDTPAHRATVPAGSVTATGSATDNQAVGQVRVGVKDRTTGLWLQADGTWGSTYAYRLADLGTPGGTTTSWSLAVNLPAGDFAFDVRARDDSGNIDGSPAWRPFSTAGG